MLREGLATVLAMVAAGAWGPAVNALVGIGALGLGYVILLGIYLGHSS